MRHSPLSAIAAVPDGAVHLGTVEPVGMEGLALWARLRRSHTRLGLSLVK